MSFQNSKFFDEFIKRHAPSLWEMLDAERDKHIVSGGPTTLVEGIWRNVKG